MSTDRLFNNLVSGEFSSDRGHELHINPRAIIIVESILKGNNGTPKERQAIYRILKNVDERPIKKKHKITTERLWNSIKRKR